MFVDFKRSTLKIPVSDRLKPMEISVFQFSVSDSHLIKLGLTQHVFMLYLLYSTLCSPFAPSRHLRTFKS